jgi:hypothetical protein
MIYDLLRNRYAFSSGPPALILASMKPFDSPTMWADNDIYLCTTTESFTFVSIISVATFLSAVAAITNKHFYCTIAYTSLIVPPLPRQQPTNRQTQQIGLGSECMFKGGKGLWNDLFTYFAPHHNATAAHYKLRITIGETTLIAISYAAKRHIAHSSRSTPTWPQAVQ